MTPRIAPSSEPSVRRAAPLLYAVVVVLIAYMHIWPASVWPLTGTWTGLAWFFVFGLFCLVALGARPALRNVALPGLLITLFAAYAWGRTVLSPTPAIGMQQAGSFVLGAALFWIGALLPAFAAWLPLGPVRESDSAIPFRVLGGVFCLIALAMSVHAILQYHWLYPRALADLRAARPGALQDPAFEGIAHALGELRVGSRWGNPNVLCGFFAMCIPLFAGMWVDLRAGARTERRRLIDMCLACSLVIMGYAIWRTDSAGGLLIALCGLVLVGVGGFWRLRHRPGTAMLLMLVGIACIHLSHDHIAIAQEKSAQEVSAAPIPGMLMSAPAPAEGPRQLRTVRQRLYYWQTGLAIWREHPILGAGLGGYERGYLRHRKMGAGETRYAHSFPVQLLAETGIVGLGVFMAFLFTLAGKVRFALRETLSRPHVLWLAVGTTLILFLLDSLGEYTFFVREPWLDFCLLAGCFAGAGCGGWDRPPPWTQEGRRRDRMGWLGLVFALLLVMLTGYPSTVCEGLARHHRQLADDALTEMRTPGLPPVERHRLLTMAFSETRKAIDYSDGHPAGWAARAEIWVRRGDLRRARSDLRKAVQRYPQSASLRARLAEIERRLGDMPAALKLVQEAIQRHPLKSDYHLKKSRYLAEQNKSWAAYRSAMRAGQTAFTPLEKRAARDWLTELNRRMDRQPAREEKP